MQESGLSDGQSADRGTKWATHASRNTKEIQDTGYKSKYNNNLEDIQLGQSGQHKRAEIRKKYRIQDTNANTANILKTYN